MTTRADERANLERPKRVSTGIQFLIASLALGTIIAALHVFRNAADTNVMLALFFVLAFFGVAFMLVNRIAARNNWARIVLLVLVIVGTPLAIPGYLANLKRSVVFGSTSIFINILQLIGTYLLFTGSSNSWFRKRK